MIDASLPGMIDEVLPTLGKMSASAVAPRRFWRHLLVIPGQREALDPESRRK
jgi:hypothetical protein